MLLKKFLSLPIIMSCEARLFANLKTKKSFKITFSKKKIADPTLDTCDN